MLPKDTNFTIILLLPGQLTLMDVEIQHRTYFLTTSHNWGSCNDASMHEFPCFFGYIMSGSKQTYIALHPSKLSLNTYDESVSVNFGLAMNSCISELQNGAVQCSITDTAMHCICNFWSSSTSKESKWNDIVESYRRQNSLESNLFSP